MKHAHCAQQRAAAGGAGKQGGVRRQRGQAQLDYRQSSKTGQTFHSKALQKQGLTRYREALWCVPVAASRKNCSRAVVTGGAFGACSEDAGAGGVGRGSPRDSCPAGSHEEALVGVAL